MIIIVNNHSDNTLSITKILKKLKIKYIITTQNSTLNNLSNKKIQGIILTGSSMMLDKKIKLDSIRADILAVFNHCIPILGICFGHEILAELHGAKISRLEKISNSKQQIININNRSPIFNSLPKKIKVYENHNLYVKTLPKDFKIIASSNKNKIEAIQHKKLNIFGLQFHPEESSEISEKIFYNFSEICKKQYKQLKCPM